MEFLAAANFFLAEGFLAHAFGLLPGIFFAFDQRYLPKETFQVARIPRHLAAPVGRKRFEQEVPRQDSAFRELALFLAEAACVAQNGQPHREVVEEAFCVTWVGRPENVGDRLQVVLSREPLEIRPRDEARHERLGSRRGDLGKVERDLDDLLEEMVRGGQAGGNQNLRHAFLIEPQVETDAGLIEEQIDRLEDLEHAVLPATIQIVEEDRDRGIGAALPCRSGCRTTSPRHP